MKRSLAILSSILMFALTFASCKQKDNMKDYIQKGFAKPAIQGDAHFTPQNVGDEGKLYVPSEEDIEVQFSIKNKYNQELKAEVNFPQEKKLMFSTEPYIKTLEPTKLVISFNFKKEAEPASANNFFGENVAIDVKIFEKSTGRSLSARTLNATCNTPPLPIKAEDIRYEEATDKYTVILPKNEGKHQDLRNVELLLSSDFGNENVPPQLVYVDNLSQQGTPHTFDVKGGPENWKLKKASGQRSLKATVYDKAGLRSSETPNKTNRYFESITLVPSSIDISLGTAETDGIPGTTIKELQEFFQGDDWKKAGYTVTYTGTGFTYDEATKKLRKDPSVGIGTYAITVSLDQGGGNVKSAVYNVYIIAASEAGIKQNELMVTDLTDYQTYGALSGAPKLQLSGPTISFTDVAGVKKGELEVPYTGFDTNLNVHVKSISSRGKVQDSSHVGDSDSQDFKFVLPKASAQTHTLIFYVKAEDGVTTKQYEIEFVRGASVEVGIDLRHEMLQVANGSVKMKWDYGKAELSSDISQPSQVASMRVAKNASVHFEINAGDNAIIKTCRPADPALSDLGMSGQSGVADIVIAENFTLNVIFRADATVTWKDYKMPSGTCGYTSGKIDFYRGDALTTYVLPDGVDAGRAIQKDKECSFTIEGFNPATHKIVSWKVNNEPEMEASLSDGSITLNAEKTKLTIAHPAGDYEVSIKTVPLYTLEFELGTESAGSFTAFPYNPLTADPYTFEVRKDSPSGSIIPADSGNERRFSRIEKDTNVYVVATEALGSIYDIAKWEKKDEINTVFSPLPGSPIELTKNTTIVSKTTIRVTLKKKQKKVSWSVPKNIVSLDIAINDAPPSPPLSPTARETNVDMGSKVQFTPVGLASHIIVTGWKINGTSYNSQPYDADGIKIESNWSLTIANVDKAYTVEFVVELKKYTVNVEIVKPASNTYEHKYKLNSSVNGSTYNADNPNPSATGDIILYTFSNVEHGTVFKFVAEEDAAGSKFAIEKWQWKKGMETVPTDMPGGNGDTKNVTVIDNINITIQLKKKTYEVKWSIQGGNDKAKIETSVNGAAPLPDGTWQTQVDVDSYVEFVPSNVAVGYHITGWKVGENVYQASDSGKNIDITPAPNWKLKLSDIKEKKKVELIVAKKKYYLSVVLEKPSTETNAINFEIELYNTDKSNEKISGTDHHPTYNFFDIEHGTNLKIVAKPKTSSNYYVIEKWQYKNESDNWQDFLISDYLKLDKTEVKWQLNKSMDIKVVVVPKLTFEFEKKGSAGELEIKKGTSDPSPKTLNATGSIDIGVSGATEFVVSVKGLQYSNSKVLRWKLNGVEKREAPYLKADGLWNEEITVTLNPHDKLKVEVNEMCSIIFSATRTRYEDGYYTGTYNIKIKKSASDTDENHVFLPLKPVVEIMNTTSTSNSDARKIWAVKDTKIDVEMTGLDPNKEIWQWRRGRVTLENTSAEWNSDYGNDNMILGKMKIENYKVVQSLSINASIRDTTCILETGVDVESLHDRNDPDAKLIKVEVSNNTGGSSWNTVGTFKDLKREKYRLKKGSRVRLKVDGDKYYLGSWKKEKGGSAISSLGDDPLEFTLNEETTLSAKVRKKLKVRLVLENSLSVRIVKIEGLLVHNNGTVKETLELNRHGQWVYFNTKLQDLGTGNLYKIKIKFTFYDTTSTTIIKLGFKKDGGSELQFWQNPKTIQDIADNGGLSSVCSGAEREIEVHIDP